MAGPLAGMKVLDFSTLLPGPYATLVLADLGADVLRVSSGTRIDLAEHMPPFVSEKKISATLAWLGRNKKTMTLNLKNEKGVKIIHQLIKEYDIILEQFRPGVMDKLGLGYKDLKKINPTLIYCSLTGYGQSGPMSMKAGHDINYMSRAGLMSHSGRKQGGPVLTGMQIADVGSGSNNVIIGILAAAMHRNKTGKGQFIDISMTDGVLAFNAMSGAAYLASGKEPERESEFINGGSLYDFYETKDGKFISFGGLEPQFFADFCRVLDCPDLKEQGVIPKDLPKEKERIRNIFKTKTQDQWVKEFEKADACIEPVLSLGEALNDPQFIERNMVVDLKMPGGGTMKQIATPIMFSETQPEYNKIGESTGTHTREILLKLGYSENEFDEFKKNGVFA
jgi:crotonobetainyl-CoA:carnitine CoA-transferase CaiB-like acyl-CoA transferase